MNRFCSALLTFLAFGLFAPFPSAAQVLTLRADPVVTGSNFGEAVAFSDAFIGIGAPGEENGTGAVYIYPFTAQHLLTQTRVTAFDGATGDQFGTAVVVHDDIVIVGAPGHAGSAGAVYVFEQDEEGWQQVAKLTPSAPSFSEQFGAALAFNGTDLLVGAPGNDTGGLDKGAVVAFRRSLTGGWAEEARILGNNAGDAFGSSLAMFENKAIIGAPSADDRRGVDAGLAYIYSRPTGQWNAVAELTHSDAAPGNAFGTAVAIHEDYIPDGIWAASGAPLLNTLNQDVGKAFTFFEDLVNDQWTQQTRLDLSKSQAHAQFGSAVALGSQYLAVGTGSSVTVGEVTIFEYDEGNGWQLRLSLPPPYTAFGTAFGTALAQLEDEFLLVGAPHYSQEAQNGGIAYLYIIEDEIFLSADQPTASAAIATLEAFPNPFQQHLKIKWALPFAATPQPLNFYLYDLLGRQVATFPRSFSAGGSETVTWEVPALPSGAYLLRMQWGTTQTTQLIHHIR